MPTFVTSLHKSLSTSDATTITTSTNLHESLSTSDATTITTSTNLHESLSTSDATTITSSSHHQITSSYYITYPSPPGGSSSGSSSDSDSGPIYVIVAAVVCFGCLIVFSVIMIIIIIIAIKNGKHIRQSQPNTRIALTTLPQSPSTSQQAPVSNQSQCPIYTQQTSKIPKINEDTLASGNPQPAASYPFSYGTEDATVGSISNSSVLPGGPTLPQSPSTSQQAPVSSQSQCPIYTQQTSKIPKINEDTLASGNPQPAASYPFSYGTEDATVGSISNSSVLPGGPTLPQSPSTSQQAPVSNQSQCPIYTQQTSKNTKNQ